jgi:hypothetical protein
MRISRRTMLRGAGGIAIALPWLEIMGEPKNANAGVGTAQRFVSVYTPGGTVIDDGAGQNRWRPTGGEMDFVMSPILEPLEPIRNKLIVMDGLSMNSAYGEQHQGGIVSFLSGWGQGGNGYASGPSVDQVIAGLVSADLPMRSLQMAVRWGTGKSHGLLHPINSINFEDADGFAPIPPRLDPQQIFDIRAALPMRSPVWRERSRSSTTSIVGSVGCRIGCRGATSSASISTSPRCASSSGRSTRCPR